MNHFLSLADLAPSELHELLEFAVELKEEWKAGGNRPLLQGKTLGMLFQKPSLRTRVSFEMGMHHLGGQALYLSPFEIQLGKRESVPDVARGRHHGACLRPHRCAHSGGVLPRAHHQWPLRL